MEVGAASPAAACGDTTRETTFPAPVRGVVVALEERSVLRAPSRVPLPYRRLYTLLLGPGVGRRFRVAVLLDTAVVVRARGAAVELLFGRLCGLLEAVRPKRTLEAVLWNAPLAEVAGAALLLVDSFNVRCE